MIVGPSAIFLKTHPSLASHGLEWFLNIMLLRIMCSSFISFKIILLYASLNLTLATPLSPRLQGSVCSIYAVIVSIISL